MTYISRQMILAIAVVWGLPVGACAHRGHPVTDSDNIRSVIPI
ncbi:hypothetical protein [Salipiger sp. PrR002]|nr:hypothetical protein [Salipiger sp. PrR002]